MTATPMGPGSNPKVPTPHTTGAGKTLQHPKVAGSHPRCDTDGWIVLIDITFCLICSGMPYEIGVSCTIF